MRSSSCVVEDRARVLLRDERRLRRVERLQVERDDRAAAVARQALDQAVADLAAGAGDQDDGLAHHGSGSALRFFDYAGGQAYTRGSARREEPVVPDNRHREARRPVLPRPRRAGARPRARERGRAHHDGPRAHRRRLGVLRGLGRTRLREPGGPEARRSDRARGRGVRHARRPRGARARPRHQVRGVPRLHDGPLLRHVALHGAADPVRAARSHRAHGARLGGGLRQLHDLVRTRARREPDPALPGGHDGAPGAHRAR